MRLNITLNLYMLPEWALSTSQNGLCLYQTNPSLILYIRVYAFRAYSWCPINICWMHTLIRIFLSKYSIITRSFLSIKYFLQLNLHETLPSWNKALDISEFGSSVWFLLLNSELGWAQRNRLSQPEAYFIRNKPQGAPQIYVYKNIYLVYLQIVKTLAYLLTQKNDSICKMR